MASEGGKFQPQGDYFFIFLSCLRLNVDNLSLEGFLSQQWNIPKSILVFSSEDWLFSPYRKTGLGLAFGDSFVVAVTYYLFILELVSIKVFKWVRYVQICVPTYFYSCFSFSTNRIG